MVMSAQEDCGKDERLGLHRMTRIIAPYFSWPRWERSSALLLLRRQTRFCSVAAPSAPEARLRRSTRQVLGQ